MNTQPLSKQLGILQDNTIGLFKIRGKDMPLELVVSNENGYLKTVHIGSLGGLITTHILASEGRLVMFGKERNLNDMKGLKHYQELKDLIDLLNSNKPIPPQIRLINEGSVNNG